MKRCFECQWMGLNPSLGCKPWISASSPRSAADIRVMGRQPAGIGVGIRWWRCSPGSNPGRAVLVPTTAVAPTSSIPPGSSQWVQLCCVSASSHRKQVYGKCESWPIMVRDISTVTLGICSSLPPQHLSIN